MSAIPADLRLAGPWRAAGLAWLLLVAAILLLFGDTAVTMVGIWSRSETFAHAFLVPPLSGWLVWRQRRRLAMLVPCTEPWILLPMALVALAWMLAEVVVVNAATQFALVALLVLSVPAVLGMPVARAILFPLLFLFFSVPFGEFMLPQMMSWTADFVVMSLQLTGVPVYREGLHFLIPSGSWSVIDECSGVRYLMASFMVGSLFAYLNYRSYRRRTVFMLFSLVTPIVANWLRAYMIVMLAHLSGNKLATGVDHLLYGWVFFGVVIMVMFLIGSRWAESEAPQPAGAAAPPGSSPRARAGWLAAPTGMALAGVALLMLPHLALSALQRAEGQALPAQLQLPGRLAGDWVAQEVDQRRYDWAPIFVNPSLEAQKVYTGAQGAVGMHVAYYRGQSEERKLVSSLNVLLPMRGSAWNQIRNGVQEVRVGDQPVTLREAELLAQQDAGLARRQHLKVWRLYWIDGRWIGGDVSAKLVGALSRLRGRGDEGAAVLLYADAGSPQASAAALQAFVDANQSTLGTLLQGTRDRR